MEEPKLLPPHQAQAPKSEAFDLAAHAAKLKDTPKEQYAQAKQEPAQAPPEAPPPEPGPGPTGDGPQTGGGGQANKPDHKAAAKEFIIAYDFIQSWSFSLYSGQDSKVFQLQQEPKDHAIHHLARGLELMGGAEVPWWAGMTMALVPPGIVNYITAKEYRQAQAEAASAQQERGPGPVAPDSITHQGQVIHMRPAPATRTPKPAKVYGPCQQCGQPVKSKGRKYCGQSCAGKATSAKRKAQKHPPVPSVSNEQP